MGKGFGRRGFLGMAGAGIAAPRVWAQGAGVPIRFSLNLPRNGTNSPFIHALERGYFAAEGIRITGMDPAAGADAMQRIATETYDVGFADLPGMAEFHLRNPDASPMGIFNVYRSTPASIVSWAGSNLRKPADLVGKTIGGPVTDNAFRLFPVFFRANGLDPQSVKFNNMDLRLREAVFMRREVDAITGFDSTIWLNLKGLGVKFDDISIMPYSAHGLDLYSNSLLVSRKTLRDNEAILPGLVRACLRGWRDAIANPASVTDALVRADGLVNRQIELERLEWVLKHQVLTDETRRDGLGDVDRARLGRSIEALAQGLQLPRVVPVEAIWTDKYLPPVDQRRVT
ncbi:MAG: ABC transporter substrate-binding protein [Azospirillum sp.]|nr:ABC transporter substrate-binding protein [Azospirillum sp.]